MPSTSTSKDRSGRGKRRTHQNAAKASVTETPEKITRKILLLHGSRQTGQILLGRLEKLQKRLRKEFQMELVAPDAPFEVPDEDNDGRHCLTWWHREGNDYQGLDRTLQFLQQEDSHIDYNPEEIVGIMGFSQGARLGHLLSLLRERGLSNQSSWFPDLRFVIFVSGYQAPIPDHFPPLDSSSNTKLSIPSLHVWGLQDPLIAPEQSESVTHEYQSPETYIHSGKHYVPTKAPDLQVYIDFIQSTLESPSSSIAPSPTNLVPPATEIEAEPKDTVSSSKEDPKADEETTMLQQDEVQALYAIFPEYIDIQSKHTAAEDSSGGELVLELPIRYHIHLRKDDEDTDEGQGVTNWPVHPLTLEVQYPYNYPLECIPNFRLIHENNSYEFPSHRSDKVLSILRETSQLELGMPSVLSGIYAIKDYLDQPATDVTDDPFHSGKTEGPPESSTTNSGQAPLQGQPLIPSSSAEQIQKCNLEGLDIAESILKQGSEHSANANASSKKSGGSGGAYTNYVIGLVGKPSAGKSTLFNAATAFSRQRGGTNDDGGNAASSGDTWGGASMAAHPFTTIDPNVGYCLIPAPHGSCPEDDVGDGNIPTEYASTHGRSPEGRRFLPVLLKDVAGLVPGAYQGRGRGNQFLNDLTDATVLIHVVDASGTADAQGNKTVLQTDQDGDSNDPPTVNDGDVFTHPKEDLAWIRNELVEWVYSNITAKWDAILRKGRVKLSGMFSGYGQRESQTQTILTALETYMEEVYQRDRALDNVAAWDQADVHRLVSTFLGVRFPMALALNKCDLPSSEAYIQDIQSSLPLHGAHVGTPMAARQEMTFVRNHLKETQDGGNDERKEVDSAPLGVWNCLTSAMRLRQPVLVFPVSDMTTLAPMAGLNKHAAECASLPSPGMIRCITSAGGSAPNVWKAQDQSYAVPSKDVAATQKLRDVIMMKPGSTVEDVFFALKKLGALSGEFVRAEACSNIGEKAKPVPKLERVGVKNRILKIMSNKRTAWQS